MEQQNLTPEQAEEMKQKLENMSPEELKEFQKQQCIFCHIISGKVPSKKIYDDDECIAVLDINPANAGHILLMPKEHYQIMPQLPDDLIRKLFIAAKHLSNSLLSAMKAKGTNIFVANGIVAGQRAQHFMIHIIPRTENDKVGLEIPENAVDKNDLEKVGDLLKLKIGSEDEEKKEVPVKKIKPKKSSKKEEEVDLDSIAKLLGDQL